MTVAEPKFFDRSTGWAWTWTTPPDVIHEVQWCHERDLWLSGIAAGGGSMRLEPMVPSWEPPADFDQAERWVREYLEVAAP